MYKTLTIGGKEYKLEYTIEAYLCNECIEKISNFSSKVFGGAGIALAMQSKTDEQDKTEEFQQSALKGIFSNIISGVGTLPSTVMSTLYAGLLEHHGTGRNGDGTIKSMDDIKNIVNDYFTDHADDGKGNFYDLLIICMEKMEEDNFFERTGVSQFMKNLIPEETKKPNRAQRRAEAKTQKK